MYYILEMYYTPAGLINSRRTYLPPQQFSTINEAPRLGKNKKDRRDS